MSEGFATRHNVGISIGTAKFESQDDSEGNRDNVLKLWQFKECSYLLVSWSCRQPIGLGAYKVYKEGILKPVARIRIILKTVAK